MMYEICIKQSIARMMMLLLTLLVKCTFEK